MAADTYAEPTVGSTLPLTALREQLADARDRGESFAESWPAAVKDVTGPLNTKARQEWRWALEHTRSTWERCYERQEATPAEQALERAYVLIDREPLADRVCVQCGGPLPATAKNGAEFCGRECRRGSEVRDRHLGPAGERQPPNMAVVVEEDWSQLELVA